MKYEKTDTYDLSLRLKQFTGEEKLFILEQIECRKKAEKKIPTFYKSDCYYTRRSLEQSTSEVVAKYKSSLFSGNTFYDLTGGLGVDDFFFSERFQHISSFDKDAHLNEIARYNFQKLKARNISRQTSGAEDFDMQRSGTKDLIYIDPDRRGDQGGRQFNIKHHSPDITAILQSGNIKSEVLIKLSPMTDIDSIIRQLSNISQIYVISHKFENKELLVHLRPDANSFKLTAVEISDEVCELDSEWKSKVPFELDHSKPFLIIPSPSVVKANSLSKMAGLYHLTSANLTGNILFSEQEALKVPGRVFKVISSGIYKPKKLKAHLNSIGMKETNIITKDFYHRPGEMYSKLNLNEGGDDFLIFTQDESSQPWFFHASRVIY